MARKTRTVRGSELSAETLMELFQEADVPVEHGPEGMGNVKVDMGGVSFLIDPYPAQSAIKIWTARELDAEVIKVDVAMRSANSFNETFLMVRNFIYQDPSDPANYRAVWDHDLIVGASGLTSVDLMAAVSLIAEVMLEALGNRENVGHA